MIHIRPTSDLRNRLNEILTVCHQDNQPVFLTRHGRGDSVIMSLTYYTQMKNLLDLYQSLSEAEAMDLAGEQGITHVEMMAQLRQRL